MTRQRRPQARGNYARVIQALVGQGFTFKVGGSGHWQVRNRDNRLVATMPVSPSDSRGWLNFIRDLKRGGLVWPPPTKKGTRTP